MKISVPVSAGELVDKLTILDIKLSKIKDKNKLAQVNYERKLLQKKYDSLKISRVTNKKLIKLRKQLLKLNTALWNIEDEIRKLEQKKEFGSRFIKKARSVYLTNDRRFIIKNKINELLGSAVKEVKEYKKYR